MDQVIRTLPASGRILAGTTTAKAKAAQLATEQRCVSVWLQVPDGAVADVMIGDQFSQPIRITPMMSTFPLPVSDLEHVWIRSTGAEVEVAWIAFIIERVELD